MKTKLDHIGILVENLNQEVIEFYQQVLGCGRAKHFHLKNSDGELNYAYLPFPTGDNYVELIEPVSGRMKDLMGKKEPGTMLEICVEVEDIEKFYNEMKSRGITLVDLTGKPLPPERKWCSIVGDDNKYAYLPTDKTFGTSIEILERNTWTRKTYWPEQG